MLAAVLPYLPTLDNYFIQDDFGVVGLLSQKPAFYFPRWFVSAWMDDIWGFTPDEVRPFPAATYQIAALWGAASPVANHVINIAFHAANALLVLDVARVAAGLTPASALFAALVFAVLPMQAESVAWITGRVDSMPACFYVASFLLYARWRMSGRTALYVWSIFLCFVALFSKQNTITLAPALVLYDVIVGRRAAQLHPCRARAERAAGMGPRTIEYWLRPYVPFALLTAGYLLLRHLLFGEIAREGMITADRFVGFVQDLSIHLRRMVFGEQGLQIPGPRAAAFVGLGAAAIVAIGFRLGGGHAARTVRPAIYFSIVWIALGVAPTLVAGYVSPRHMYLAAVGWAIAVGVAVEVLWHARPTRLLRPAGIAAGAIVLAAYALQLREGVRVWKTRSEVSRRAVADIEREALAAPEGTLVLAGAPRRSWEWALPHALRPPFTRDDLTRRVSVISHSSLHCCGAHQWEEYTRRTLRTWISRPERSPMVALYWDPTTGELSRLSERDDPFLRPLMTVWLETGDGDALDRLILDALDKLVATRRLTPRPGANQAMLLGKPVTGSTN